MKVEWNKVTWYSKLVALVFFVALPFLGLYLGIKYGEAKQRVADNTMILRNTSSTVETNADAYYKNVATWQIDQNHVGWSIAYPIDFDMNDNYANAAQDNWREGMPGGPGLKLFTLTIPRAFEPQTNFADATLTVGASADPNAVKQCFVPEPTDGNQEPPLPRRP